MFSKYKIVDNHLYLYINNYYEFSSDIYSKDVFKKKNNLNEIVKEYIEVNNLNVEKKVYIAHKDDVIGYLNVK